MSKKILIVTHCFPSKEGDLVGNFLYDFSKRLKELGHSVTIFTPKMNTEYDTNYILKASDEFCTFDWFGGDKRLAEFKVYNLKDIFSLVSLFYRGRQSLKNHLAYHNYDIILAPWLVPNGYYAVSEAVGTPIATWILGSDINVYAKKPVLKKMVFQVLEKADYIFTNSRGVQKELISKYSKYSILLPTNKKVNIENIENREKSDKFTLTFVGRLEHVKGIDIFIEAIKKSGIKDFNAIIIGDGSLRDQAESLVEKYNLLKNVEFTGFLDSTGVSENLLKSDYLVISSRSEGMPVVFWEAMQLGVPVLSTDVGDVKYYCDRYDVGRVCEISSDALAKEIKFAYEFRDMRVSLSGNTQRISEAVSIEKSAEKFLEVTKL